MRILRRLFDMSRDQSPLREFLSALSFEQAALTYRNVSNSDLRLPAALSTWALHLAHRYTEGLLEMVRALNKPAGLALDAAYDQVAIEAAAVVHYWLMREFLQEDEVDDADQPYFDVLRDAAQISNSILTQKAPAIASETWLFKRAMKFSHGEVFKSESLGKEFSSLIIAAVGNANDGNAGLYVQLAAASYYPIFLSTHLEQFRKSARGMYIAHQEGDL